MQKYQNALLGFSLEFPDDWMIDEDVESEYEGAMGIDFFRPPEDDNDFSEFLNVNVLDVSEIEPFTAEEFFQDQKEFMEQVAGYFEFRESGKVPVAGYEAPFLLCSLDPETAEEHDLPIDVLQRHYFIVHKDRLYIFQASWLASSQAQWESVLKQIVASIELH